MKKFTIMIKVIKREEFYSLSYFKISEHEVYQMEKHGLEDYEVGQYMGGN